MRPELQPADPTSRQGASTGAGAPGGDPPPWLAMGQLARAPPLPKRSRRSRFPATRPPSRTPTGATNPTEPHAQQQRPPNGAPRSPLRPARSVPLPTTAADRTNRPPSGARVGLPAPRLAPRGSAPHLSPASARPRRAAAEWSVYQLRARAKLCAASARWCVADSWSACQSKAGAPPPATPSHLSNTVQRANDFNNRAGRSAADSRGPVRPQRQKHSN